MILQMMMMMMLMMIGITRTIIMKMVMLMLMVVLKVVMLLVLIMVIMMLGYDVWIVLICPYSCSMGLHEDILIEANRQMAIIRGRIVIALVIFSLAIEH